jgi:hypothetical protein
MKGKMEECMKGGMSGEKMQMMEKMMGQFFANAKTEGEGKEEACGEKKSEKPECCPEVDKVFDFCSQMMEKCFASSEAEDKEKEKTRDDEKSEDTGCCPDMSKATDGCTQMMEKFFPHMKPGNSGEGTP